MGMNLECCHVLISVSDLDLAREFYEKKLALPVIEDHPRMFAVRAGGVRFSILGGGDRREDDNPVGQATTIMLRTDNLEKAMAELSDRGVDFEDEINEAPGFMRYVSLSDPDGNELYLAQYISDPLAFAVK
jgi:predicted enzyme related to lactoylglutathione lyase